MFYSSTFAPETLSLAAAIATIKKLKEKDVISKIWQYGGDLKQRVEKIIKKYDLENVISLKGFSPWIVVSFQDHPNASRALLRTFFQKEMISLGVFILTSHNINYSHTQEDMDLIEASYDKILSKLKDCLRQNTVQDSVGTKMLEPVFSVRKV